MQPEARSCRLGNNPFLSTSSIFIFLISDVSSDGLFSSSFPDHIFLMANWTSWSMANRTASKSVCLILMKSLGVS